MEGEDKEAELGIISGAKAMIEIIGFLTPSHDCSFNPPSSSLFFYITPLFFPPAPSPSTSASSPPSLSQNPNPKSLWYHTLSTQAASEGVPFGLLFMMVVDKEDLGLSLSLSFPQDPHRPLQLNLIPSLLPASPSPSPSPFALQKAAWQDPFPSSGTFLCCCLPGSVCVLFAFWEASDLVPFGPWEKVRAKKNSFCCGFELYFFLVFFLFVFFFSASKRCKRNVFPNRMLFVTDEYLHCVLKGVFQIPFSFTYFYIFFPFSLSRSFALLSLFLFFSFFSFRFKDSENPLLFDYNS